MVVRRLDNLRACEPKPRCLARWLTIDTLSILNGDIWLIADLKTIQSAVVQEESEDDGQQSRRRARSDDDSPDSINSLFAFFLILQVESASHFPEVLHVFEAEKNPEPDQLRKCLPDGLHHEDTGQHRGSRFGAGPFGCYDCAEGIFGTNSLQPVSNSIFSSLGKASAESSHLCP